MLANREGYTQRLLRLKTLDSDFRVARASLDNKSCSDEAVPSSGDRPNASRRSSASSCGAGVNKYARTSQLWMRKPPSHHHRRHRTHQPNQTLQPQQSQFAMPSSNSPMAGTDMETRICLQEGQSSLLMDRQTNNNRRGYNGFGRRNGGVTTVVPNHAGTIGEVDGSDDDDKDFDGSEEEESLDAPELQDSNISCSDFVAMNENAVSRDANALVKQTISSPAEIINTSQLPEEGKVETKYEESQDDLEEFQETDYKLIDEYEKTFAYARRLRGLLSMKFKVADRGGIETNFLLVKAHEHPTQKVLDRWRNVDIGQPYDTQIRQKKLIDDYKQICAQRKPKIGETQVPVFPDWLRFYIRFKKENSDKRWNDFMEYRQKMMKLSGGKTNVPKANDMYLPEYYDVWSTTIIAYAKPETTLLELIDPVFAKLGLESRADFKFTIGTFVGDKRTGKARIPNNPSMAEEVTLQVKCSDLYQRNCGEIFVNDNRLEMFQEFPAFFSGSGLMDSLGDDGKASDGDKKKKKAQKAKNQSNQEEESGQAPASLVPKGPEPQGRAETGVKSPRSEPIDPSCVDDTLTTEMSIAEEVDNFDRSSPFDVRHGIVRAQ